MAFNFSPNFGFLIQTGVYNHNGQYDPAAILTTTNTSDNIKVILYPRWYKHIAVEWSVPADWGNCLFNVYFCQQEDGPFERLNPVPIDGTFLLDVETQELSKFNRGYYIVEAILLDQASVSIKSKPHTWDTAQRRWVQIRSTEIQRREYLLLSKFVGIKTYIYRRRTYGERCPECWNKESEKSIKDHCNTCYGTTFKGGYFPGTLSYLQYEATGNANMKTYFGQFEPNQVGAWTIAWPDIRPDDIIVRVGDWGVYRVEQRANTELQGNTVRQMLQLTQLAKDDIEYQLVAKSVPDFPVNYI